MATVPAPPPLEIITATFGPFLTGIMMQQLFMGVVVVQVYVSVSIGWAVYSGVNQLYYS